MGYALSIVWKKNNWWCVFNPFSMCYAMKKVEYCCSYVLQFQTLGLDINLLASMCWAVQCQAAWTIFLDSISKKSLPLRTKHGCRPYPAKAFDPSRNLSDWSAITPLFPPGMTHLNSIRPKTLLAAHQEMFLIPFSTQECLCILCSKFYNCPCCESRIVAFSSPLKVSRPS